VADRVIKILRSTYADFGPTLATEMLRTKHGIELAKETVRRLQIAVGQCAIYPLGTRYANS
jgi:hypothetical protein